MIVLGLMFSNLSSQSKLSVEKKLTPTGFGKLKINKTTVSDLLKGDSDILYFFLIKNNIDTLTGNGPDFNEFGSEFSNILIYSNLYYGYKVRMGIIKEYTIGESKINLALVFYNDTLVQLTIANLNSELHDQWKLKYGDGILTSQLKKIKCSNMYGEFSEEELYSTVNWGNNLSKVLATWEFDKYYDSKCQKQYMDYFKVQNPKKMKIVETISNKNILKIQGLIERKKKNEALKSDL